MEAFAGSDVTKKAAISQHWHQIYERDSSDVPGRGPQAENHRGTLPDKVPYSGPKKTASTDTESNELNIDLAASSATVFIMTKK